MAWRVAFGTVYPRICPSCARSCRGRRVPAPTACAMGAGLHRPCCARVFRVSKGHKKRASPHPVAAYAGPPARTSRQEVRRARGPGRSIVAVGAGRALRSFRSPPAGRFGPSAQVPTGHALPSGALRAVFRIRRHARRIRKPCASKATLRRPPPAPKGSVCPVGTCAKRKATRRREQIQGLRAASAQNADICEVPTAQPPAK